MSRREWRLKDLQATELEEQAIAARRLVRTLDPPELQILGCLVRGMSEKHTAMSTGVLVNDVRRSRTSMMKKLAATRTADAVRIGLYAGIDRPD